jgi:hypothetical protein
MSIDGTVFIVTKARENIRLGLVSVTAISEDAMLAHARGKSAQLQRTDHWTERESQIQLGIKEAPYKGDEYNKLLAELGEIEIEKKRRREIWDRFQLDPRAFFFEALPVPLAAAVTDAEGKFAIRVPGGTAVILVAQSSRQVGDKWETYHWLCRVTLAPDATHTTVLLSSHNLLTEDQARLAVIGAIPSI